MCLLKVLQHECVSSGCVGYSIQVAYDGRRWRQVHGMSPPQAPSAAAGPRGSRLIYIKHIHHSSPDFNDYSPALLDLLVFLRLFYSRLSDTRFMCGSWGTGWGGREEEGRRDSRRLREGIRKTKIVLNSLCQLAQQADLALGSPVTSPSCGGVWCYPGGALTHGLYSRTVRVHTPHVVSERKLST